MINKAALDQAYAARKKYRSDTPVSLYSIEGEDTVFIAAYLEAIAALSGNSRQSAVTKFSTHGAEELASKIMGEHMAKNYTTPSDWLPHNGGECPVPGDTVVDVKMQPYASILRFKASKAPWHMVMEYRIVKPGAV